MEIIPDCPVRKGRGLRARRRREARTRCLHQDVELVASQSSLISFLARRTLQESLLGWLSPRSRHAGGVNRFGREAHTPRQGIVKQSELLVRDQLRRLERGQCHPSVDQAQTCSQPEWRDRRLCSRLSLHLGSHLFLHFGAQFCLQLLSQIQKWLVAGVKHSRAVVRRRSGDW